VHASAGAHGQAHAPARVTVRRAHVPATSGARQPFDICRVDDAIPDGNYEINNNNFGRTRECLTGNRGTPAFRVSASGAKSNSPGSDAYPDILDGCSWDICSPHSRLPAKVRDVRNLRTTFDSDDKAGGTWGAGYDMFFDPRPLHTGQARVESMIWLNARNAYNPAGKGWPEVRLDDALYWVLSWETTNGHQHWRYIQFRKVNPVSRENNMPLGPFFNYLQRKHWITPSWYLLNIEAGFEIWSGGKGLAVNHFAVTR
jgi:hypothetical protein